MFWITAAAVVTGYVIAVFTWDKVHTWIIGAAAKAEQLRQKARDIEITLRSKV